MPFIPAPEGTVRCVHHFTVQGQECLCVVYVHVGGDPSAAELLTLANDMFGAWQTHLLPNQAAEITFDYVTCTAVEEEDGLQVTSTVSAQPGGSANPAAPNALAFLISLRTAFSGRSRRGRFSIPGMRGDLIDTDSNYWTTGLTNELQTDATAWLAAVNDIDTIGATENQLVVASYYSGTDAEGDPIPRASAELTPVTSVLARRRIATQRRRRPRS